MISKLSQYLLICAVVLGVVVFYTYYFQQQRLQKELNSLNNRHEILESNYRDLLKKTAITELMVRGHTLQVRIKNALGEEELIDTPFDPANEIYVDFAVLENRIWIRRIFDNKTAPDQALLIDSRLAEIDWNHTDHRLGKAVYRSLSNGRWVVTLDGAGGLGLRKAGILEAPANLPSMPLPVEPPEEPEE